MAVRRHPAEAVDGAQRRAQVVRDGVGEGFQLFVRAGQLARAPRHARLQGAVEREHLGLGAQAVGDVLDLHQAGDALPLLAGHLRVGQVHVPEVAVVAQQLARDPVDAARGTARAQFRGAVHAREQAVEVAPQEFLGRGAEDVGQGQVAVDDPAVAIQQRLADGGEAHRAAEALLAAPVGVAHARGDPLRARLRARQDHRQREQQQRGQHAYVDRPRRPQQPGAFARVRRLMEIQPPAPAVYLFDHAVAGALDAGCREVRVVDREHREFGRAPGIRDVASGLADVDDAHRHALAPFGHGVGDEHVQAERSADPAGQRRGARGGIGRNDAAAIHRGVDDQPGTRPGLHRRHRRGDARGRARACGPHGVGLHRLGEHVEADRVGVAQGLRLEQHDRAVFRACAGWIDPEQHARGMALLELELLQLRGRHRRGVAEPEHGRKPLRQVQAFGIVAPLARARALHRGQQRHAAARDQLVGQQLLAQAGSHLLGIGDEPGLGQRPLPVAGAGRVDGHEGQRGEQDQARQHVALAGWQRLASGHVVADDHRRRG